MKIGIFCIFDHWPEVNTVPQYFREFLDLTQRAEDLGFDSAGIGDPDQVIAKLEHFQRELGMNQFIFFLNWGGMDYQRTVQSLERFAKYVLPHFRRTEAPAMRTTVAAS